MKGKGATCFFHFIPSTYHKKRKGRRWRIAFNI